MTLLLRRVTVLRSIALLAALGVLLPLYGPHVDPGYAEGIPGHSHIMLESSDLAAHHAGTDDGGVLAVPGPDDGGAFAVVLAAVAAALVLAGSMPSLGGLLRSASSRLATAPAGWNSAPAAPPPKVFLVIVSVR